MAQCTANLCFTATGCTSQDEILCLPNPLATDQTGHDSLVQSATRTIVISRSTGNCVKTKRYFTTGYFDGCWKSCKARFLSAWLRPTVQRHRFCASSNSSFVLKFSGWGGSGSFICDSCWRKSTLLTAWRDGISHRVMAPMEFMQRLAALVPRPRLHLIRFHGVLAPNAKLRKAVVPVPPTATVPAHASDCDHLPVGSAKGACVGRNC